MVSCTSEPALPSGLDVTVDANSSCEITGTPTEGISRRNFIIKGQASNGTQSSALVELEVLKDPFIGIWKTDLPGYTNTNSLELPFDGNGGPWEVDWGDGNTTVVTDKDDIIGRKHVYAAPGSYTVTIDGYFELRGSHSNDITKLTDIQEWGGLYFDDNTRFSGASSMTISAVDVPVIAGTSLARVFEFCTALVNISNLPTWNTSSITDMTQAFRGATAWNGDLSAWNYSSVENMSNFLSGATSFNALHYDNLLNAWVAQPLQPNVTVDTSSHYTTSISGSARSTLTSAPLNWVIDDLGGL